MVKAHAAITELIFRTGLREASVSQADSEHTELMVNGLAAATPGMPDASGASAIATGTDGGDTKRADAPQPIFPSRGRHVATGHRNDPIFVYTNVNPGGTLGRT